MILDRGDASGLSHRPASILGARVSETMSLQLLCSHNSISFTRAGERKEAPAPRWAVVRQAYAWKARREANRRRHQAEGFRVQ
jgi:hypothetical protein